MIYLDYSATTKVDKEVIDSFVKACDYLGNPNSLHKLGVDAKEIIDASTNQINNLLRLNGKEVIYTSGSSEANNLAIKCICDKYSNRGNHIITTSLEHSSIYGPINYLIDKGYSVDFVDLDEFGRVNLKHLESLINDNTILVSINGINSELGIKQPIEEIGKLLKKYPKVFFHADLTQAIGKVFIDTTNIDLFSFSAHKFFGIKGIGCLVKNKNLIIEPLIHGGKSTTNYRSGTPTTQLIVSLAKALRLATFEMDRKYEYVEKLNKRIQDKLITYDKVYINSNEYSIPHILNISVLGVKPETLLHALEEYDIYISTQSACSVSNSVSKAVLSVTKNNERAQSSVRISLSYKTTEEEIDKFLEAFDKCYLKLTNLR